MEFHRRQPRGIRLAVAAVGCLAVAGCSRSFPDETARISVDGTTITFDLGACGLDDDTVFLVGQTDEGDVLQAVIGVEPADDEDDTFTALPQASGLTYTDDDREWAGFGPVAWALRGEQGTPPGEVTSAELEGSRITLEASVVPIDDARVVEGPQREATLEARCDATPTA